MKIALLKEIHDVTGGAEVAIDHIEEGLKEIGQDVISGPHLDELLHADFIFLNNAWFCFKKSCETLQAHRKRFGIVAFYENFADYFSYSQGFAAFVEVCLRQEQRRLFTIEQLFEIPEIIVAFSSHTSIFAPTYFKENSPFLEEAEICIANSHTEAQYLRRDSPNCHAKVIYWHTDIPDQHMKEIDDSFLRWTGLKKGEYILQVGRIEMRKNQIASVLAAKDLDQPLVFIATLYDHFYLRLLLKSISTFRRAPTWIITQHLESMQEGNLRILQMPKKQKLDLTLLMSAYQNAGLYLHPAFCELPGYVILEAAKLGVPIVASSWTTIKDYFTDHRTGQYTLDDRIAYCPPHHVQEMTEKIALQFGRKIDKNFVHPIFQRTKADIARELMESMDG